MCNSNADCRKINVNQDKTMIAKQHFHLKAAFSIFIPANIKCSIVSASQTDFILQVMVDFKIKYLNNKK